ncbi:MAG: fliM [Symbiobacteriaceae bacterium]|nr:fliM [Symbiobacteriaceae bacterium]
MENGLSQADIDALMRALLPAGGEDLFQSKGNNVRPYDFRRPTKFKKDLLRTLVMIHENFARLLQSFCMAQLRTRVQIQVRGTNQYSYTEYLQLLRNPTVVGTFRMAPLPGTCLIEVSQNIAYAIIDRVFGGNGTDAQPQRALSEIERGVIQRILSDLMNLLQEAWRSVAEVDPVMESLETNPVFLKPTSTSEVVAAITIGFEIGEHMGHITLALPHTTVEPLLSRLTGSQSGAAHETMGDEQVLPESLSGAPVPVSAFLGSTRITVSQFADLQVGDLILLPTRLDAELPVHAGDRLTFFGRPGVTGRRMSLKITRRVPIPEP